MKKIFLPIILAISTIFISCTDPVFFYITKDVSSETATVNGIIRSIARYTIDNTEYIVTTSSNGIIYKSVGTKNGTDFSFDETTQSHGKWKTISSNQLPFELHNYDYTTASHKGQQILKIVADSENLYVLTTSYDIYSDKGTSCPDKFYIYKIKPTESEKGNWKTLEKADWEEIFDSNDSINKEKILYAYDDYHYTAMNLFSSNSPIKSERKVLLRIGDESSNNGKIQYFEINNGIFTEKTISASDILDSDLEGTNVSLNGIAVLDGKTYYAKSRALTTNATFLEDATAMYWGQNEYLYYKTKSGEITKSVDANYTITSLGICKDAIIIGRGQNSSSNMSSSGGVEKVQFTKTNGEYTDIPEDKLGSFTTNAQTQLLTSYLVQTVFNSTPGKQELDSALYASLYFIGSGSSTSVSFENIGLWSYYSTRGNWNRE